jgi:hypothetical protein
VFAYLPVTQLAELPFIIQGDFVLIGSRQSVSDNGWNRKLREEIASLFILAVRMVVGEQTKLSYSWIAYLPGNLMGFWEPLRDMIRTRLLSEWVFYSRAGTFCPLSRLRTLKTSFKHQDRPLLNRTATHWEFLSPQYGPPYSRMLESLGVKPVTMAEALEVLETDLTAQDSEFYGTALSDSWHESLLVFVKHCLVDAYLKARLFALPIIPVRINGQSQWYCTGQTAYLPNVVDEGTGSDRVKIDMPDMIDIPVLRPEAVASNRLRLSQYKDIGVSACPPDVLCFAVERQQKLPGTKFTKDLQTYLEILFWYSHKRGMGTLPFLIATACKDGYSSTSALFMRSDRPFEAEYLLSLATNPQYSKHFLDPSYQKSSVSTRTRDGLTWKQWLLQVAGVRYHPPLADLTDQTKLHWAMEAVRKENASMFIPVIQHYWVQEYGQLCWSGGPIQKTLMQSRVLCRNNQFAELSNTWFPSKRIVEISKFCGVDDLLPVLALPESADGLMLSDWPCLTRLGCRTAEDMPLLREVLAILASSSDDPPAVNRMNWLYGALGRSAAFQDREQLKVCTCLLLRRLLTILGRF